MMAKAASVIGLPLPTQPMLKLISTASLPPPQYNLPGVLAADFMGSDVLLSPVGADRLTFGQEDSRHSTGAEEAIGMFNEVAANNTINPLITYVAKMLFLFFVA